MNKSLYPLHQQLAACFEEIADLMTLLNANAFKVNSAKKVARILDEQGTQINKIGADKKALQKIAGIGEGSATRIVEFIETGEMQDLNELREKVPAGLMPMLNISGLGPKKIALFWHEAGIESMAELKKVLEDEPERIQSLKGMGAKTIANIKKSIAFAESGGGRVHLGRALPLAMLFMEMLKASEVGQTIKQIQYAGSLRRGKETIGDIDLIVACENDHAAAIHEAFQKLEMVTEVLVSGKTKTSVRTTQNIQVDLRTVQSHQFGAALLYFTGSQDHNIRLRERARKMDATLNEYALTSLKDESVIAAETEEEVYKALDLKWIPPELREDWGEVSMAEKQLPVLIAIEDIGADLHSHTTASDGKWTIEEIVNFYIARGYHTLAITDHSRSQFQANGLDDKRLLGHIKQIKKVAAMYADEIQLLAGSEVDILADGSLDYIDEILEQLDVVVASPHAALNQDPAKATDRLIKAIEHPLVHIIGHPTGRLVLRREGLHPDMDALIDAAAANDTALEINSNHYRLDLRDTHARAAIEKGVKLSINTDAHSDADPGQLTYGILTARRAGATREDVINCLPPDQLKDWLKKKRK